MLSCCRGPSGENGVGSETSNSDPWVYQSAPEDVLQEPFSNQALLTIWGEFPGEIA